MISMVNYQSWCPGSDTCQGRN